jgi:hypothetical protein
VSAYLQKETQIESLAAARARLQEARVAKCKAETAYHEALLTLAPDPEDDLDTAVGKAEKFEALEDDFLVTSALYREAEVRCQWEERQALPAD